MYGNMTCIVMCLEAAGYLLRRISHLIQCSKVLGQYKCTIMKLFKLPSMQAAAFQSEQQTISTEWCTPLKKNPSCAICIS